MDKDKIGLIKYVSILGLEIILPIVWFLSILSIFFIPDSHIYPNIIATTRFISWLILVIVLPIIYLLLPIITTILAIKYHWSTYLDKFFNSFIVPTILFFLAIVVTIIYKHLAYFSGQGGECLLDIYYAIVPPYCLIYLVILIHNIRRKYFNK